jgi:superfamily I DNA/RNA helicase
MYSYGAEDFVGFVEELENYTKDARECIDYILDNSLLPYIYHEDGVDISEDLGETSSLEEFDILKELVEDGMDAVEFIDKFEEMDFSDDVSENKCTIIMTVHKAKGLERPNVIVNTTRMPCTIPVVPEGQARFYQKENLAEERNIFYVAITRAKERVIVIHSDTFNRKTMPTSPFFREIGGNAPGKIPSGERAIVVRERQMEKFKEGFSKELLERGHGDRIIADGASDNDVQDGFVHESFEQIMDFFRKKVIREE